MFFFFFAKMPEILHVVFNWIEKHHPVFFWLVCCSFSRNNICKKPSVFQAASLGDLMLNEKQQMKPFVFTKGWSHYNTLVSYYCFVSASGQGAEPTGIKFVLPWHRLDTRSAIFFSLCVFTPFKNQDIYLKTNCVMERNLGTDFSHKLLWRETVHESIECQSKYHSDRRKRDVMH